MISQKQLFLQHVGQTSKNPSMLEIKRAEGIYLYGKDGKKYIDLISGVSVSNLGHSHPAIINAVKTQADKYMHLLVYGELVQSPQVEFAKLLAMQLPNNLESTYFVNSGSEANEGAMKLAKRYTGRSEIIAFKNAYHGGTHGVLSLMSDNRLTLAFRPLLPDIKFLEFNNTTDLKQITEKTACVIIEPIQGEAGIVLPKNDFLIKLQEKCNEKGALLIFDEIQTGFGRTGKLFAFQKYNVQPDIITIAKAMGGGMPIGAFVSSKKIMDSLTSNPELGHITTFGGHPVSAAAALANLKVLINDKIIENTNNKAKLLLSLLKHEKIKSVRGAGLFYSVELKSKELLDNYMNKAIDYGIITDRFLFCDNRFRIAPPLIISEKEIKEVVKVILSVLDDI